MRSMLPAATGSWRASAQTLVARACQGQRGRAAARNIASARSTATTCARGKRRRSSRRRLAGAGAEVEHAAAVPARRTAGGRADRCAPGAAATRIARSAGRRRRTIAARRGDPSANSGSAMTMAGMIRFTRMGGLRAKPLPVQRAAYPPATHRALPKESRADARCPGARSAAGWRYPEAMLHQASLSASARALSPTISGCMASRGRQRQTVARWRPARNRSTSPRSRCRRQGSSCTSLRAARLAAARAGGGAVVYISARRLDQRLHQGFAAGHESAEAATGFAEVAINTGTRPCSIP